MLSNKLYLFSVSSVVFRNPMQNAKILQLRINKKIAQASTQNQATINQQTSYN